MKKTNKKLLTLLLAGAFSTAALGFGLMTANTVNADETAATETATTYALMSVFASSHEGIIGAGKRAKTDTDETTKFTFAYNADSNRKVTFHRDLALKWFDEVDGQVAAQYLTLKFYFADKNFEEINFTVESESALATENSKATNKVTFAKDADENITISVNGELAQYTITDINEEVTLSLGAINGAQYGDYSVIVNEKTVGKFTNIGSYYADYTHEEMIPLTIDAKLVEGASTAIYLTELNNQAFDNVTKKSDTDETKVVADTTAPVLVVNEEINDGFLLGTAFSFNYVTIDVLPSTISESTTFYQWNPADEKESYTGLKSSPYFMDTTYYLDKNGKAHKTAEAAGADYTATSVYQQEGVEYLSIKIEVGDTTHKENNTTLKRKTYHLAWYANDTAVESKTFNWVENDVDKTSTTSYIILNREESGPSYNYITADETSKTNIVDDAIQAQITTFETELNAAAAEAVAGSNSYVYFPSLAWLIDDNNGYRNLKFTISYKSPTSDSTKTSSDLSYNGLRLSAADEGWYEFKIFATDKAGNTMKYYLDGELVDVTSSNVWDIEAIPSFHYEVSYKGISVKSTSDTLANRQDTEIKDETFKFTDVTLVGANNKKSAYSLWKVDTSKYTGGKLITQSILAGVTFAEIKATFDSENKVPADGQDYFDLYLDIYAKKIAAALGDDANWEQVKACFIRIEAFNDKITEDDAEWDVNNKYNWNPTSKSFDTIEESEFIIFADYWESDLPSQRAVAYVVVKVESEMDIIKGETEWLKNNIVSVVLFSIAAVMLVLIIILLLVKPSEETLEDVDTKAEAKKVKKKKKNK